MELLRGHLEPRSPGASVVLDDQESYVPPHRHEPDQHDRVEVKGHLRDQANLQKIRADGGLTIFAPDAP